jgi:hypothetical protein
MADQAATVNGGPKVAIDSPLTAGVFGNLAEFASDVTTLGELQTKLALLDLKESTGKLVLPVAALVVAGVLGLAALPVLLLGIGALIAELTSLSLGVSYLIVAVATIVLAGILAAVFLPRIGPAFASFERSKEELTRNLSWLKTVLAHSGRRPTHHRRTP